jgi:hypothetical protein
MAVAKKRKRKSVSTTKKVASSRKSTTKLQKGEKLISEIERLEVKRANSGDKATKDFYQVHINALHKQLDRLLKQV